MLSRLIFEETKDFFNQLDLVNRYFPELDLRGLRTQINECFQGSRFFISGFGLTNFILHVAIVLERKLNGFPDVGDHPAFVTGKPIDTDIRSLSDEICDRVESIYAVTIAPFERDSFEILLSSSLLDRAELLSNNVYDERALQLTREICAHLSSEFSLSLMRPGFETRFALHLANLMERSRQGIVLRNPQLSSIKNDYPLVYDLAVTASELIRSKTGFAISEDEIAYIALHLGCFVEEEGAARNKLYASLVFPLHNPGREQFVERIKQNFDANVALVEIVDSIDEIAPRRRPDLVITTQPLQGRFPLPVVEVSPFLGERDITSIKERIDQLRRERFRSTMEANLHEYFSRELFFPAPDFVDWRDALRTMADELIEGGFAEEDFTEKLFEREAISSSAYRDIAIPHPIDMDAKNTAVAVSLHPKPIVWNGTPVHVVLMLCVRREERVVFRDVFECVTGAMSEPGCAKRLAQAESFDEFVKLLLSYV